MAATERLYYNDSLLVTFTATVTDIREYSRDDRQSLWQVALDRSAFYPTSGGQPFDLGLLRATSRLGNVLELPVVAVEEDEHGEVWHFVQKPLISGTQIEGLVDWPRRLDHMQQHSGQHLLSAVFARELGAHTLSFHLGEETSSIDLDCTALDESALTRMERIANEQIAENRPVRVRQVTRAEAETLLAAGELRKLPERDGDLRIIEIEEYDRNACGGTHVQATGQIGSLLIRGTEKVTRGLRVHYVCGLRAVKAARHDAEILAVTAAQLSVGAPDVPASVERLRSEAKASAKVNHKLREELAHYQAAQIAVEVPIQNGLRWVDRVMNDRDADYLRMLASSLVAAVPRTIALLSCVQGQTARLVLASSLDLNLHCGEAMKRVLAHFGLRGGGSPGLAQTDVPLGQLAEVRAALQTELRKPPEA
uniref:Alanyl-tRNA editing protein n=1 Tax=Acidobacterium capsulatum TaxID=33075 RepID=A0A7V5CU56_9BACT